MPASKFNSEPNGGIVDVSSKLVRVSPNVESLSAELAKFQSAVERAVAEVKFCVTLCRFDKEHVCVHIVSSAYRTLKETHWSSIQGTRDERMLYVRVQAHATHSKYEPQFESV